MEYIFPIALIILVILSKSMFGKVFKNHEEGDELIKNPWFEIHAIPGYTESRAIAAFYPLKGEPNIMPILEQLCEEGRLLLPKVTGPTTMEFYPIKSLRKDLVKGNFGIMEPREGLEPYKGEKGEIKVFLVPGTKFNMTGERKGHGKGYYDRFLANYPEAYKAGIASPKQISKEPLEQKETDIKMNQVIVCRAKV